MNRESSGELNSVSISILFLENVPRGTKLNNSVNLMGSNANGGLIHNSGTIEFTGKVNFKNNQFSRLDDKSLLGALIDNSKEMKFKDIDISNHNVSTSIAPILCAFPS